MSEPLDRARRVVATGACVLALVIGTLGAAAWRLVETETADAAVRGKSAAQMAADDLLRELAARVSSDGKSAIVLSLSGELIHPEPPRRFRPMPPLADAESAFYIRESESWSGELRRAALRRAVRSDDAATRYAAAAAGVRQELRDGSGEAWTWNEPDSLFDRDTDLGATRDGVLLRLVRPHRFESTFGGASFGNFDASAGLAVLGSEDDELAASMLVAANPDGAQLVRQRHAELAEIATLRAAFRAGFDGDADTRVAMLSDGGAMAARRSEERWFLVRVDASAVADTTRRILAPRAMRLVRADATTLPAAVPFPGDGGWAIAASFAESESRSRSTLLLAGLGVAALASIAAFAAFARSVRRDARLATLRTEFVATVSHELRTPVAVVRTSAETLAAGRATNDADRQTLTTAIVRESERLSTLVGNVLDFARMEAGKRAYELRETDVASLLRDVAARHPGVTCELAADVPPLRCDADAIAGAVGNLLDNARKFGAASATVTLRAVLRGDEVVIEVEDHGIGVPDAEKPHVFERFFRGADAKVKETRGAGIGLALVQHAARAHGGRVEIADTPGGGATFRIALPLAQNGDR